jgi:hypothetical protein
MAEEIQPTLGKATRGGFKVHCGYDHCRAVLKGIWTWTTPGLSDDPDRTGIMLCPRCKRPNRLPPRVGGKR